MIDPNVLFEQIFAPGNEELANAYLGSLLSELQSEEECSIKLRQLALLNEYFESGDHPRKEYFMEMIREIVEILHRDCAANGWEISSKEGQV